MQQQKNRVEVQGNNLHFALFETKENANYSPEPRLCCFVAAQFETSLLVDSVLKLETFCSDVNHSLFTLANKFASGRLLLALKWQRGKPGI